MAANKKAIKLRMKSVRNTRKITKAMELVAASKMRRAIAQALKSRTYARAAEQTIGDALAHLPEGVSHALLQVHPHAKKTLFIVLSSDRGLAGGLNANLVRFSRDTLKDIPNDVLDVIAVGKKGGDGLQRLGKNVVARFPALSNNPALADLLPVAHMALSGFLEGTYKEVRVLFTDFVSGVSQVPATNTLLPLTRVATEGADAKPDALFEPSAQEVLDATLPALAETLLWQMLLESVASEHAARMMAMKNASDAASDMLSSLTFTYNQARQGAITQEIAEISGGKSALESE